MTYSMNLQVSSVTVTTHTATFNVHQAPNVPLNYFYYPDDEMSVESCRVVWINYDEPTSVVLAGTDTQTGKPVEKSYGISQAPYWVLQLLRKNLSDMGWKILKEKDA